MIISHRHRFIFIKTMKTASTSIEIALSAICGPDDVITPLIEQDERKRTNLGYRGPQNYALPNGQKLFNHVGARFVRRVVGEQIWRDYFTFCFERNPWDKVISWYFWQCAQGEIDFADFIKHGRFAEVAGPGGFDLYSHNGEVIVDQVYRYEDLDAELARLAERWNVTIPPLLRAKSKYRQDRRHYSALYTPELRARVATAFQRQIELFGYRFEVPGPGAP